MILGLLSLERLIFLKKTRLELFLIRSQCFNQCQLVTEIIKKEKRNIPGGRKLK
jgi:hypothetical protein